MQLRVNPWFTDASIKFLNNFFKWYPGLIEEKITVLEWGGGNSSIYFLQKNCKVCTVEDNPSFISDLISLSDTLNLKSIIVKELDELKDNFDDYDFLILDISEKKIIQKDIFNIINWSIIVNDGANRAEVLEGLQENSIGSIVILDNIEYAANWGRLARSSGKRQTSLSYRKFLRSSKWCKYLFEQTEGRAGHYVADHTGWESPNRWITGILWNEQHLLSRLMVTHSGLPIVNQSGAYDDDLKDVEERCPFDWDSMTWGVEEYPDSLDLKLEKNFE